MARKHRHPLEKEDFMEGNRQKWVAIGLVITTSVMVMNVLYHIDPAPYLQAVMLLIGAGVLGWSVDSAVKAYKVDSSFSSSQAVTTTTSESHSVTETDLKEEKLLQLEHVDPKDVDSEAFK